MPSLFERGIRKLKRETLRKASTVYGSTKVAIIGCGGIAGAHINAYEELGTARVVAAADVSPAALARGLAKWPGVTAYRDYRQMLRETNPDVISICTWGQHHAEMVIEAARAGVQGIFCEKPLALQVDQMEEMLSACHQQGVKLAGGHQFRFHPNFIRLAEMIKAGSLGTVQTVRATMSGSLVNRGPHLIDTVRFVLGDVPAETATCECRRNGDEFLRGLPEETSASGEILFEGGIRLEFQSGHPQSNVLRITVEGTAGAAEVTSESFAVNDKITKTPKTSIRPKQFGEFIQWAKGRRAGYAADGLQSMKSAELVLALYEAARLGERVQLPLENKGNVLEQLYPDPVPEAPVVRSRLPGPELAAKQPKEKRLAMDGGDRTVKSWFANQPSLGLPEIVGLTKVVMSKKLSSTGGKVTRVLEEKFARMYGSPYAVASTSGTSALHVALGAVNPEPCDEVITTPMSDMGTVIPILCCNCVPVFADVDPITGNLTAETIAEKITPRTRAVIVVHLFGRPADMTPIRELASSHGIVLIEDCAQAHFAEYDGKKVGSIGDFGCFSFQSSKQITCGDGGMTLVNSKEYYGRAALYADKGFDRKRPDPTIMFLSPNYRMTELQAAVTLAQLGRLEGLSKARQESASALTKCLREMPQVILPEDRAGTKCAWWRYTFSIDEEAVGVSTQDFVTVLSTEGVKTSKEFPPRPLFEHDMLLKQATYGSSRYPFSAVQQAAPGIEDFPGFREFAGRVIPIGWSAQVKQQHVKSIGAAVRKSIRILSDSNTRSESLAATAEY